MHKLELVAAYRLQIGLYLLAFQGLPLGVVIKTYRCEEFAQSKVGAEQLSHTGNTIRHTRILRRRNQMVVAQGLCRTINTVSMSEGIPPCCQLPHPFKY